jgi:hypothetical protein
MACGAVAVLRGARLDEVSIRAPDWQKLTATINM